MMKTIVEYLKEAKEKQTFDTSKCAVCIQEYIDENGVVNYQRIFISESDYLKGHYPPNSKAFYGTFKEIYPQVRKYLGE